MTYLFLDLFFLAVVGIASLTVRKLLPWKTIALATLVLVAMTAIFDNAIIGFGIVAYNEELISGLKIGFAPIEDFAYALASPLLTSVAMEVTKSLRAR
ncbi:MAG: lycopene cyclase domain-containing protein [Rhodoluna sp.]